MRILGTNYDASVNSRSTYYYRLLDDEANPARGDWHINESGERSFVIEVLSEEEMRAKHPGVELDMSLYPLARYFIDRAPERAIEQKKRRVKEIRKTLNDLKAKSEARRALEEMAAAGGDEGKSLLKELDGLEADLA